MRFEFLLELALTFLLLEALYQFAVSLYGLGGTVPARTVPPRRKFAIFIPAHNEEAVIGANVRSLKKLHYPRSLYDIHVIADHCSDETSREAEEAGAIVLARNTGQADGKPGALNWAWGQLGGKLDDYDAVVIVDSDNIVAPNFLSVMNNRFEAGERVIQANLDVKNPDDSWVTRAIAIAYWATGRIHQLARHKLGWCVALGGTGICIDRKLLAAIGWDTDCLTEDLDFQIRALQLGTRTTWAHETRIFDEKPTELSASLRQRLRWMRGHMSVAVSQSFSLLATGASKMSWACFDAVLYLLQPFKLAIGFVCLLAWFLWAGLGDPQFQLPAAAVATFGFLYIFHLSQYLFWGVGFFALMREGIPARYYASYVYALALGVTWLIVVFAAMLKPRGSWMPTEHSAKVEIGERLALEAESWGSPARAAGVTELLTSEQGSAGDVGRSKQGETS
jgi:cellulose synthase/poly-beta-1,6-N-acetylglucosamine synthase-like glycosyltransferase